MAKYSNTLYQVGLYGIFILSIIALLIFVRINEEPFATTSPTSSSSSGSQAVTPRQNISESVVLRKQQAPQSNLSIASRQQFQSPQQIDINKIKEMEAQKAMQQAPQAQISPMQREPQYTPPQQAMREEAARIGFGAVAEVGRGNTSDPFAGNPQGLQAYQQQQAQSPQAIANQQKIKEMEASAPRSAYHDSLTPEQKAQYALAQSVGSSSDGVTNLTMFGRFDAMLTPEQKALAALENERARQQGQVVIRTPAVPTQMSPAQQVMQDYQAAANAAAQRHLLQSQGIIPAMTPAQQALQQQAMQFQMTPEQEALQRQLALQNYLANRMA